MPSDLEQKLEAIAVKFRLARTKTVEYTPGGISSGNPTKVATPLEVTASGADFYEVAVWDVKAALLEAFKQGFDHAADGLIERMDKKSPRTESKDKSV